MSDRTRMILAPHADDEALGCGGLISKHPEGSHVVILSDKGDGRLTEYAEAASILGQGRTHTLPFITGTLTENMRMLVTRLDALLRDVRPDELYLPTPGAHQDHLATYEAGIRASRLSYTADAWYVPHVFLYDVPSYSTDLYTIPYQWNRFEVLTEEQMTKKMQAIEAYGSQMSGAFNPAHFAREHARFIGAQRNVAYAEQFAVVRSIA